MTTAFVLLNVSLGTEGSVISKLTEVDGVRQAWQIYGIFDIIAKIEAEDAANVRAILQERIRRLDNIRSTLTLMAV